MLELCLWSTGWQSPIHQPHQGDSYQGRKKCCHGSLLPTDSRSRDHTLASWTHVQGNTDEYWPLQLGQVHNMLSIVEICCHILFNFKVCTSSVPSGKIQRKRLESTIQQIVLQTNFLRFLVPKPKWIIRDWSKKWNDVLKIPLKIIEFVSCA